ncbi:hypothetical protein [Coraliomargarita parva]|uniref:hypothetical protein n=1 Tax=Coraliomargarita parva TaxID=3014050 RepID=UPI0022B55B7D|nr:hypothetical protein [Coraliomargarita parva]
MKVFLRKIFLCLFALSCIQMTACSQAIDFDIGFLYRLKLGDSIRVYKDVLGAPYEKAQHPGFYAYAWENKKLFIQAIVRSNRVDEVLVLKVDGNQYHRESSRDIPPWFTSILAATTSLAGSVSGSSFSEAWEELVYSEYGMDELPWRDGYISAKYNCVAVCYWFSDVNTKENLYLGFISKIPEDVDEDQFVESWLRRLEVSVELMKVRHNTSS